MLQVYVLTKIQVCLMLPNVQIIIQQMGIGVQFNKSWRLRNTSLQNVRLMLWNSSNCTNLQIIEWA